MIEQRESVGVDRRVVFDFAYLREPEEFESRVNSSDGWLDVDTEFLEAHGAFAARFRARVETGFAESHL